MAKGASAVRYAQAVFGLAVEKEDFDRWQEDLSALSGLLSDDVVVAALENSRIGTEVKTGWLKVAFPSMGVLAVNLALLLMARTGGLRLVPQIAGSFAALVDRHRGIRRGLVTTAAPVSDGELEDITRRLGEIVGGQVVVTTSVDPSLLGGLVARVDGKLLDLSVRQRLVALKKQIAGSSR